MKSKIYIHKNQINCFRTRSFGTSVVEFNVSLNPTEGYVECEVTVPERTATITEEQFEEAFRREGNYLSSHSGVVGRIREAFFGER